MTVLNVWDGLCKQRDARTGEWKTKRIVVGRNSLHVVSDGIAVNDGKITKKGSFSASVSYNLNQFKMEVGSMELDTLEYYCLFLVSGHTKVSFAFDTKLQLQVNSTESYLCWWCAKVDWEV